MLNSANKTSIRLIGVLACGLFLSLVSCGGRIGLQPQVFEVVLPDSLDFRAVGFTSTGEGWAVGGNRFSHTLLYRSRDEGEAWTPQEPTRPIERVMYDLLVRDENSAIAGGLHDEVLVTTDAGQTWRPVQVAGREWLPVRGLGMQDDTTVYAAVGGSYNAGGIYRSRNFGLSWSRVDSLNFEPRDIVFPDRETGYLCGFATILKSVDGGDTWDLTPAEDEFFVALSFVTPELGYAVGRTGTILKTTDGGDSWDRLRNGNNFLLPRHRYSDVVFLDAEIGYIVGDKGLILKTTDGGGNWQKFERSLEQNLFQIHVFEEGRAYVVGSEGTLFYFEE